MNLDKATSYAFKRSQKSADLQNKGIYYFDRLVPKDVPGQVYNTDDSF